LHQVPKKTKQNCENSFPQLIKVSKISYLRGVYKSGIDVGKRGETCFDFRIIPFKLLFSIINKCSWGENPSHLVVLLPRNGAAPNQQYPFGNFKGPFEGGKLRNLHTKVGGSKYLRRYL